MRTLVAIVTLVVSLLGACGGAPANAPASASLGPSAVAAPSAGSTVAPPSASATPSLTASPAAASQALSDPAPPELAGRWQTTEGERITVTFVADRYTISRGSGSARGRLAVVGEKLSLFGSDLCVRTGDYTWAIDGGTLTIRETSVADPCGNRRDALIGRSFVRP